MMKRVVLFATASLVLFASCSSSKKLRTAREQYNKLDSLYRVRESELSVCQALLKESKNKEDNLNDQIGTQKSYNAQMFSQLKDLSVISGSQAESIKKSLDNISSKDNYIKGLQSEMARKDSLTMTLVMNLKGVIGNMDDQDIDIKVDKGVVYVDISDKLLFKSGSYDVTDKAKEVLGIVAKVLINQPDIEFMVEGHTDNVPFHQGLLVDNWDLSVKRANSVVRILQNQYGMPAAKMTAAGRGEYKPISSNDTNEGRAKNRRTRIVILPQLDQFFKLLEKK